MRKIWLLWANMRSNFTTCYFHLRILTIIAVWTIAERIEIFIWIVRRFFGFWQTKFTLWWRRGIFRQTIIVFVTITTGIAGRIVSPIKPSSLWAVKSDCSIKILLTTQKITTSPIVTNDFYKDFLFSLAVNGWKNDLIKLCCLYKDFFSCSLWKVEVSFQNEHSYSGGSTRGVFF